MSADDNFGEVSLIDLMGVDLNQVDEARFGELFPRSFCVFECGEPKMEELKDNKVGSPTHGKVIGAIVTFPWHCIGVKEVNKEEGIDDPSKLIGKVHNDLYFLKGATNLKYLKGYIADVGGDKTKPLGEGIKSVMGKRITAVVSHRADPNDSDKKYAGLRKYKPYVEA